MLNIKEEIQEVQDPPTSAVPQERSPPNEPLTNGPAGAAPSLPTTNH